VQILCANETGDIEDGPWGGFVGRRGLRRERGRNVWKPISGCFCCKCNLLASSKMNLKKLVEINYLNILLGETLIKFDLK